MMKLTSCVLALLINCALSSGGNVTSRILGGSPVGAVTTYPWMVAIHKSAPTTGFVGGGTLITTGWVLTSAIVAKSATSFKVIYNSLIYNSGAAVAATSVPHPGHTTPFNHNNIGLLRLAQTLTGVKVVPLMPRKMCCDLEETAKKYVLTGWGITATSGSLPSTNLMQLYQSVMTNLVCMAAVNVWGPANIIPSVMCSPSTGTSSAASFDDGDPLMVLDPATSAPQYQVGVVSLYKPSIPTVYTRVCQYHDWIQFVTGFNLG